MRFGARLHDAMTTRGRFCVGIDPHSSLLHDWGLDDDVAGLERFALTVVEAVAPHVSVVKPQSAFYERFGSRGVAVLERVIAESRAAGALVLLDVKRGDIGSTSQAYADAYLDPASPLASDAITASPFLGFGSIDPMIETARRHDAGVFVLALTSNKEGPEVQHARTGRRAAPWQVRCSPTSPTSTPMPRPLGDFGAVIGATIGSSDERLDFNGPVLAPGFGAQGGTVDDLKRIFGAAARNVLPSSSREVLAAGPDLGRPARRGPARQRRRRRPGRRMRRCAGGSPSRPSLLAGCGGDETSAYCESVKDHQRELSDIVASNEPSARSSMRWTPTGTWRSRRHVILATNGAR